MATAYEVERIPRDELEQLQLDRLRDVICRVYGRVAFHRERLAEAGVRPDSIRSLDDVRRLPFTQKADLREHYPFGLLAVPLREVVRVHASSGTTGKPTVVAYTRDDLEVWTEVMARTLAAGGVGPADVVQNAYGYGLFTGGLGFHYGAERLGATVIPLSGGFTERQLMALHEWGSTVLCCTPSYSLHLAEALAEAGIPRDKLRLRLGFFGAEPWTEAMRAQIEGRLGLTALNVYGLSEVIGPGVAVECPEQQGMHVHEDHFLLEVIDPETLVPVPPGTPGELVFTTLTKEALPLLRYRTGDLSMLLAEPCRCGRTSRRIGRITGRTDDMMIIRG
ncbi:MAG: phenylacetate--CoA ligase, partial [Candidatus Rokubacteria bacterium]|nr:phenylacetate--CoA ligase [Candidatus Rokubacteria bacterium]